MGNTISYTESPYTLDLGPHGALNGTKYSSKAIRYAGVPYAVSPTGANRWRKPQALSSNHVYQSNGKSPFDATKFHPPCYQNFFKAEAEEQIYSEDCLRVNIWTPLPETKPEKGWPVYIWLHGGWMQMGDPSQEPGMSPVELISTGGLNAIVVAVGYRLNVFGFLSGAALRDESGGKEVGNYGLWDQLCALEWVQKYIGAFGGNADNVTLAGRSAGAYGVHAQMLHDFRTRTRETQEPVLFHRAFMCSNAIPAQPKTVEETQEQYDELLQKLHIESTLPGSEQLHKLREVEAQKLIDTIKTMKYHTFRPVTDDVFIHSGMVDYHMSGAFAAEFKKRKCRLLIGEVLNEETLYATYNAPTEPTVESLRIQLENYYAPATVERILTEYSLPKTGDLSQWKNLFGAIVADGQVRAPSRLVVTSLLSNGVDIKDVWRYQIAYRLSFITEKVAAKSFGVAHAMDKPIWNFSIMHGPTKQEHQLMQDWIKDLVALVQDDHEHNFGTERPEEMKVMTLSGQTEVKDDERYSELVDLAHVFCGS